MTEETKTRIKEYASDEERESRGQMLELLKSAPIPEEQLLSNIGLFIESKNLSRLLFMDFLYRQIVDIHGSVIEFGCRWGQNTALFAALRGIYEPFNRHRKIIAFDTFEGFPSVSDNDGNSEMIFEGNLAVGEDYGQYLEQVLSAHEDLNPMSHVKKHEICQGDSVEEWPRYLERHPETIVSLAYFDFDLYAPTKACLELLKPRLTKGSIIGFDELNDADSPGETLAVMDVLDLRKISLKRHPHTSRTSYCIVE